MARQPAAVACAPGGTRRRGATPRRHMDTISASGHNLHSAPLARLQPHDAMVMTPLTCPETESPPR